MSNYDYEILRYLVKWEINGEHKEQFFGTEESAVKFARKIDTACDTVSIVQERSVIGWWK